MMDLKKILPKQIFVFSLLMIVIPGILWGSPALLSGESSSFSFSLMPGVTVPVGTYSGIFKPGNGVTLSFTCDPPTLPFFLQGSGTYNFVPLANDYSISLITLHADGGATFSIIPGITAAPSASFGYYFGFLNEDLQYYGSHPYGALGIKCAFSLSKTVTIGVNAGYRHFFGLYDDVNFSVSSSLSLPGKQESAIDLSPPYFYEIFPVLMNYYTDNPVGSMSIHNNSLTPVRITDISLFINKYMKEPRVTTLNRKVESSNNLDVELFARFAENILDLEAEQEAEATIRIEYLIDGRKKQKKLKSPVFIHPRNIISSNNPEQIAAFVSRNDPVVDQFTKTLKKTLEEYTLTDINPNILIAIMIYNAVKVYGINLINQQPAGSYETIQLPGTTLIEKQGDRVDMAVLLSSIFESLDVETALIYTPETCFIAFSLDNDPASVKELYTNVDNLIIAKDSTWVPLTIPSESPEFFQAVKQGAESWKKYNNNDTAVFYPVHDLPETYAVLDMSENQPEAIIEPPPKEELKKQNNEDLSEYLYQVSTPKPRLLETVNEIGEENIKIMNSLAVLYAKYNYYNKAISILNTILLNEDYVPALINMGNIYFLKKEMKKACAYFERAYEKDPVHPVILLNLSRVNFAMENYGNAKENYRKLVSIDQDLADLYKYLEYSGQEALIQAAKTERKKKVIWIEGE